MKKELPVRPSLWALMGPAFVWAAIAQGSGELIWWPYFAAKYGAAFLGLLLPASLIQFFVNREVARYTAATGRGIWSGFFGLSMHFAWFLFFLCVLNFLWLGGYASAGGTALFELIRFPSSFDAQSGTIFWACVLMAGFSLIFVFSKVIYRTIENLMKIISLITVLGLIFAACQPEVLRALPSFAKSFFNPLSLRWPNSWDWADSSHLVTAIAFAGMGGFLNLLYSYWLKDKGIGMAFYAEKISGLLNKSKPEKPQEKLVFADSLVNRERWRQWLAFVNFDSFLAVFINAFTAGLTTLLAFAVLYPKGLYPSGWKIAVVQAEFFRSGFGTAGVLIFLIVASAFMIDTWLGLVDGVARQFADFISQVNQKKSFRFWYWFFLGFLILTSAATVFLAQPGVLITIVGVISIFAFVLYLPALWYLNYVKLPREMPQFVKPKKWESITLFLTWFFYLAVAAGYLYVTIG